jgi:hypothetical protein
MAIKTGLMLFGIVIAGRNYLLRAPRRGTTRSTRGSINGRKNPELIAAEKEEHAHLAELFQWPKTAL